MNQTDAFAVAMRAKGLKLRGAAAKVVAYIDGNRAVAVTSSAADIAALAGTSDATVIRSVQALGFSGMAELKRALVAALDTGATPADDMRRTLVDVGAGAEKAIEEVFDAHEQAMGRLRANDVEVRVRAAVSLLASADRILLFGIGPSSHLARYAAMMLARGGRTTSVLDATGMGLADQLLGVRRGDALLMLAYGRPYAEAAAVVKQCRWLGIPIALVTDDAGAGVAPEVDLVLVAGRGRGARVALHGATLVVLEAIVLALAAIDGSGAIECLERLNRLRDLMAK